jgi:tetratricopeptide (TPR) repeat protein
MFKQLFLLCLLGLPTACGGATPTRAQVPDGTAEDGAHERNRLFELGRRAAERGDSVRAEQYLSLALDRGYPEARILPLLLRVCIAGSRLRAALDHAEPYLREHPEQDALRLLVASIHIGLAQPEQARAELDSLLRRNPRFDEALFLRAILLASSDAEAARADLRAYLDIAPKGSHAPEVRSRLSELALLEPTTGAMTP